MRSSSSLSAGVILLFSILQYTAAADSKCYSLNGTELDETYAPCNPDAKHSGCCALRRPAGSVDICLSNGLCMATNDQFMGSIWQGGCTDPTGKDEGCPKMCPDARDNFNAGKRVSSWNIQMCDFGSYCCREPDDHNNCCLNSTIPRVNTNFIGKFQFETSTFGASSTKVTGASATASSEPTKAFGTAVTSGVPATASSTSTATSLPASEDLCKDEKKKTAFVGGMVSGIFSAALLSAVSVIIWLYRKEKTQRKLKEHYETQFETSWAYRNGNRPRTAGFDSDEGSVRTMVIKDGHAVTENYMRIR